MSHLKAGSEVRQDFGPRMEKGGPDSFGPTWKICSVRRFALPFAGGTKVRGGARHSGWPLGKALAAASLLAAVISAKFPALEDGSKDGLFQPLTSGTASPDKADTQNLSRSSTRYTVQPYFYFHDHEIKVVFEDQDS